MRPDNIGMNTLTAVHEDFIDVHGFTPETSADRKVTVEIKVNKTGFVVKVENAFGLPAHVTCPGMTAFCTDDARCYAYKIERQYGANNGPAPKMRRNLDGLLACGDDSSLMAAALDRMVASFVVAAIAAGVVLVFRIHWDGDFYSEPYAAAWADVIRRYPDVQFWVYTRSFTEQVNVVPILADIRNLALYLSVDRHNVDRAMVVLADRPTVNVAACAPTFAEAEALLHYMGRRRGLKCPELSGRIPLVSVPDERRPAQPGEVGTGACVACGLCVYGRGDVRFASLKR